MPTPVANTVQMDDGVVTIDTDYVRPILDASHLIIENGRAAFVDTGTSYSVPLLLDALKQQDLDVGDVDYLFVTHVHLDHSGGAGELLRHLPNAKIVIHPRGAPHIVDPAKLIRGTIAVYGLERFRELYKTVVPVPEWRVVVMHDMQSFDLAGRTLTCFFTEGHARHHYCVWDPTSNGVFTGDSFGVSYRELDTDDGEFIFPSSTPIDFDPAEAHKSVDRILSFESSQAFLTHYSRVGDMLRLADDLHQGIDFFQGLAQGYATDPNRTESIRDGMFDYFFVRLQTHGYAGERSEAHAILDFDVRINTMGLEVWLDRTASN